MHLKKSVLIRKTLKRKYKITESNFLWLSIQTPINELVI